MMVTDGAGNRDRLRAERDSETMGQWDSGSELQPGSESRFGGSSDPDG